MSPSERRKHVRTAILSWDWREQPDLDELDRLIYDLSGCALRLYQVDTGSDEYAVVLATEALDEATVDAVYRRFTTGGPEIDHV